MNQEKIMSILFPYYYNEVQRIKKDNINLAYYTDLSTAFLVLRNKEIWLRNVMCMNDYNEVKQGLGTLRKYLIDKLDYRNRLLNILCRIGKERKYWEDVLNELLINNEYTYFLNTYIACFTEHKAGDDDGNLNMFRVYGRNKGAAMIFADFMDLDVPVALSKVLYCSEFEFKQYLDQFIESLENNVDFLSKIDIKTFENLFKQTILFAILSIKNPAYKEDNEWRIIYCDKLMFNPECSKFYKLEVEVINGLPQKIYKLKFEDRLNFKNLLKNIIVEKIPDLAVATMALNYYLEKQKLANNIIKYSDIPIRMW